MIASQLKLKARYGLKDSPSEGTENIRKGLFTLMAVTWDGRAVIRNKDYGEKFVSPEQLIPKEKWALLYKKWRTKYVEDERRANEAQRAYRAKEAAVRAAQRERRRIRAEKKRAKLLVRAEFTKEIREDIAVLEDALLERFKGVSLSAQFAKKNPDPSNVRMKITIPLKQCMERLIPLFKRSNR